MDNKAASTLKTTQASKTAEAVSVANNNNNHISSKSAATNGIKENNSNNITSTTATSNTLSGFECSSGTVATSSTPLLGASKNSEANKENKRTPPPVSPITKGLDITSTPLVKKEKRQSSSRYNVSKNCELTPLSPLNENYSLLE